MTSLASRPSGAIRAGAEVRKASRVTTTTTSSAMSMSCRWTLASAGDAAYRPRASIPHGVRKNVRTRSWAVAASVVGPTNACRPGTSSPPGATTRSNLPTERHCSTDREWLMTHPLNVAGSAQATA